MSDYIPEEVIVEILVRLPVKSLIKCTTVCKSWKLLIQSSAFIDTHLKRRNDDTDLLLLNVVDEKETGLFNRFMTPSLKTGESKILYHPALPGNENENMIPMLTVSGTCNGLVFLSSRSHLCYPAVIWNPSIRRFVDLPMPKAIDGIVWDTSHFTLLWLFSATL